MRSTTRGDSLRASIELLPDAAGEAVVRGCWEALSAAGLPGRGDHQGLSNWPHLTVWESATHVADRPGVARSDVPAPAVVPVDRLRPVLDLLPVTVSVLGTAVLGGPGRGVVVLELDAAPLEPLRAAVCTVAGADVRWRRTHWRPHLSLSRALPADRVEPALAVVDGLLAGVEQVTLARLRTWDPAVGRTDEIAVLSGHAPHVSGNTTDRGLIGDR